MATSLGINDNEGFEIEDALEIAHGNIEQVADTGWQALKETHTCEQGRSQFDVAKGVRGEL